VESIAYIYYSLFGTTVGAISSHSRETLNVIIIGSLLVLASDTCSSFAGWYTSLLRDPDIVPLEVPFFIYALVCHGTVINTPGNVARKIETSVFTVRYEPHAHTAATLAYDLCPDLGILSKADRTWRQTRGSTWYTRHHTATLPSHLAKHTMGNNLLLALSYHVRSGLKSAYPLPSPPPLAPPFTLRLYNPVSPTSVVPSLLFLPLSSLLRPELSARLFPYGNSDVFFISFQVDCFTL
jgi:hypothetical protein